MVTEHTVVTTIVDLVRQAYCGLHGHDSLLQFGRERMFLQCMSCGHESPGWELTETPTTRIEAKAAHRPMPRFVSPQLVRTRRVA